MKKLDITFYSKTIPSIYKPVPVDLLCETLEINTEWQIKLINEDTVLKNFVIKQANPEVFKDNRHRTHLSKEGFIIWVIGLDHKFLKPEKQPLLIAYKLNLFKYFFQSTIEREEIIQTKISKETRKKELEEKLKDNEDYCELMKIKASISNLGNTMKKIDRQVGSQLFLF